MKKMSFSGKCIAKMFSLKRLLVSECIFEIDFFCESCKESKLGTCFRGCGHGLGGFCGFDGFDGFSEFDGFNGLGRFCGFDGLSGFGGFDG